MKKTEKLKAVFWKVTLLFLYLQFMIQKKESVLQQYYLKTTSYQIVRKKGTHYFDITISLCLMFH